MKFDDIPFYQDLIAQLKHGISEGRIPHAQFFQGDEGSGNLALAIAYAQEIIGGSTLDMFGQTDDRAARLLHPDLHIVFPVVQGKYKISAPLIHEFRDAYANNPYMLFTEWMDQMEANNKTPIISVSESEEIYKSLSLKSYEGGYKVLIIWQADKMNIGCSNKMLKLIEEPPEKTVIILIGNDLKDLLPTIQSRVQLVLVKPCATKEISGFLTSNGVGKDQMALTVSLANGSPGMVLSLANEEKDDEVFDAFITLMRIAFQNNVPGAIDWVDGMAKQGKAFQMQLINYGVEIYRQAIRMKLVPEAVVLNQKQEGFLKKFSPFIHDKNIEQLMETHQKTHYSLTRNGNSKLVLLDHVFKLMRLIKA